MAIIIDETRNRVDYNVALEVTVVADARPDGELSQRFSLCLLLDARNRRRKDSP